MTDATIDDALLDVIRSKLRSENIKLWEDPYLKIEDDPNQTFIDLSKRYAQELQIDELKTKKILEQLQNYSLKRLEEKGTSRNSGVLTLNIKYVKKSKEVVLTEMKINQGSTGKELIKLLGNLLGTTESQLKVICQGKLLKIDQSLDEQNVKGGSRLLVFEIPDMKDLGVLQTLDATKKDVSVLTNNILDDDPELIQIEDHHGQSVSLPVEERRALTAAMMLHEKGRSFMKKSEYSTAILFFLESEKEFRSCQDAILSSVDNFALLNLDMVWCYLNLQSLSDLPDAFRRLQLCEEGFIKSYGPNMERVLALKGSTSNEETLMLRLTLLKAIVFYHTNKMDQACALLKQSENKLNSLAVDDTKMTEIMHLGYSQAEARVSLRACNNDLDSAIHFLLNNQEEKKQLRKERDEKKKEAKLRIKLGKTKNGDLVNIGFYKSLLLMGFSKILSKAALKRTDNDISEAITILQESPEILIEQPSTSHSNDELLSEIMSLGFTIEQSRLAISKCGCKEASIKYLLEGSCRNTGDSEESDDSDEENDELHKKQLEAFKRFKSDLDTSEYDYLDIDLEQEKNFLTMYKTLLKLD